METLTCINKKFYSSCFILGLGFWKNLTFILPDSLRSNQLASIQRVHKHCMEQTLLDDNKQKKKIKMVQIGNESKYTEAGEQPCIPK